MEYGLSLVTCFVTPHSYLPSLALESPHLGALSLPNTASSVESRSPGLLFSGSGSMMRKTRPMQHEHQQLRVDITTRNKLKHDACVSFLLWLHITWNANRGLSPQ
ncbi:hypothetical protein AUEXF2481DRAFT_408660 [Aureobasidium subglaciale EXF-2481]|uniref:Uncharacterized protein n=1 Tax=Aureobasidium subglaciale (strain EXF-2481) TaxID=1043005 RepID=A0A074YNH0_AURSE|nr:uncharacterized protein AUEXF2481DRAFT_408660 [Aureobasidium subglaciale EXF-2481]KEQ99240.1 hypothetical protein AUEXF2481DRAFT_408660 [Aureobasidium subglaciale EXF-2481]